MPTIAKLFKQVEALVYNQRAIADTETRVSVAENGDNFHIRWSAHPDAPGVPLAELYQLARRLVDAYRADADNIMVTLTENGQGFRLRWIYNGAVPPQPRHIDGDMSLRALADPDAASEASSTSDGEFMVLSDEEDDDTTINGEEVNEHDMHPDDLTNHIMVGLREVGRGLDEDGRVVPLDGARRSEAGLDAPQQDRSDSTGSNHNNIDEARSPTPGPSRPSASRGAQPLGRTDTEIVDHRAGVRPGNVNARQNYRLAPGFQKQIEEEMAREFRRRCCGKNLRSPAKRK
ncbi:hypothetical protein GLOTRDRAFT_94737 [Gloeophyllum trabeum ATCC 11539]|uniref:Uncharacterized protein n=1 Tax=Gloeophyllum trabeum (strain ATCC 11539 / FP-39264 / Madison 617) TaxID=670483 RepID=S7RLH2_GLOTA|nr:uncharacterized protein GLOTRDRAFT_94737 [Gloeophyllum trabeum ATCC 11539]EPQ53504.1 hypothetical protein GLOTRDRAFT_94737 [Gloeophyllum trabeum ATCC 11539]